MSDATKLPTSSELQFFYWADKPKLTVGLTDDSDDTTLYWSTPPRNRSGAIIDGGFLVGATNKAGKTERIWVPVGAVSDDGLSAVGCVRGIDPNGLDYTVGDDNFILTVDGGSPLTCVIAAQAGELLRAAIQGIIATGGSGIILGTDADGTVTLYRSTGVGTYVGFLRWNTSNDKTEYSNDGSAWNTFDNVTASNLVVVTNSDTTPGNLQNKTASGTGITRTVLNPGGNEQLEFSVNGTLANLISDVTATATEINQALDGISANVTAANLNTLTGGPSSNADALHTHSGLGVFSITFGEDIDGSATPKAAFISPGTSASDTYPLQVQETENDAGTNTYGVNFSAMTFTTGTFQTKITQFDLMLMKAAAGGDIQIDIYAVDGSHKPTGASLGSATVTAASIVTTNQAWYSFALALTVTPATEYAIVAKVITGTAVNYIRWSVGNGNTYSGGQAWTSADAGATWSSQANDFAFRVWGYEAQTAGRVYQTDKDEPFRGGFDGFVTSNTAVGVAGTFRMEGTQASFTGLTAGAIYYTDSTLGGYTTSTGGLKIGKAISTTQIQIDKAGGFVEVPVVTSVNLGQDVTLVKSYQALLGCGFKPSRVELDIEISAQTGAVANVRTKDFQGDYTGSLNGQTVNMGNDAAFIPSVTMINAGTGFSVADGAAAATTSIGSFLNTLNGLTCSFSVATALASSAGGSIRARCFR